MGRHSIPDPEDSAGEDTPAEPPTQRLGRQQPAEPDDGPGYREPGYDESGHGETDYDEPDYPNADYPEPDEDHAQPQPGRGGGPPRRHGRRERSTPVNGKVANGRAATVRWRPAGAASASA